MLRKTSIVSIISLCLTTPCYSGLYLGAEGGPEGASFRQSAHVIGVDFNAVDTNHFSGTGGFGSLFVGYSRAYNQYYLAVELNGNLSSVEYDLTNNEFVHQNFAKTFFTIRHSEGVSLLPGIFLSDTTLFYGRVAYSNGRLKIVEGADPTINNITKNVSGIRYGVGIRHALTPRWALLLDYSQINYRHVKSHFFDPVGLVTKDTKITPNTAQFGLGIVLNFECLPIYTK